MTTMRKIDLTEAEGFDPAYSFRDMLVAFLTDGGLGLTLTQFSERLPLITRIQDKANECVLLDAKEWGWLQEANQRVKITVGFTPAIEVLLARVVDPPQVEVGEKG